MSLLRPILKRAITRPRKTLVVDDRGETSGLKLVLGSMFLARHVERHTDRPHVGLMLPTSGAFNLALLGCWLARRVAVPLNYLLNKDELRFVVEDSDIDVVFTSRKLLEALGLDEATLGVPLVCLEDLSFKGFPPLRWPADAADDDLAVLIYTSGTSGKPKGVELTHGNLAFDVESAIGYAALDEVSGFLGVLPQFHSFGLTALTLMPMYVGAKCVYTARFVPRKIVELMKEHRPAVFFAVPSMYAALAGVKSADADDFKSLTIPVSGGEPLPDEVATRFHERFGVRILEGYGLTETAPVTHWSKPDAAKPHSVGRALPGVETYLVADDGKTLLGPNEDGEIVIVGPNVMRGYYKRPDLTDEVIKPLTVPGRDEPARAFFTGDIGRVDDEGFLFITGRKKEMLIVGGENVFPREIEDVLVRHESVAAAAVIGQRDGVRGEVPLAFIELAEGATFDEAAIRGFARERLAGYKVPREVRVVDELPRSPTGKVLRRKLSAE